MSCRSMFVVQSMCGSGFFSTARSDALHQLSSFGVFT